ncbi:MAG: L-rhamnose isomerase [Anaerovoracaceae bacterium]|jgi:L-rhamnose isomerase
MNLYENARELYKEKYGIDTDKAMETLAAVPVSLHCWQGDDVRGFDTDPDKPLTGGIQTTGNYPGRARTPEELMADIDEVLKLVPGKVKMNLHASYAIFDSENGGWVDRDRLEPKHFEKWVRFCKERHLGCDFNPTFFSHPKCDPLTLASPNEDTRKFWIDHGKACIRISQYLAEELGEPCVMNIWTGDGFKDVPGDRKGPRERYRDSIDQILAEPFDFNKVKPCVESKVFGIGVESYTAGSAEFSLLYAAANKDRCIPLMDNGHYHPTEVVSDKISSLLTFFPEIALHVTRPVRWDSDHVVLFDDETKEIMREIVRCHGLDGSVHIALDYFDASINRIAAWVTGFRNVQKALLYALLQPNEKLKQLQDQSRFTELMAIQEDLKTAPFGAVWDEYLKKQGIPAEYMPEIKDYEKKILEVRQ